MHKNMVVFKNQKEKVSDGVYLLSPEDHTQIENITALHQKLLPESPLSLMGKKFLERFYYSGLIRTGLIKCFYYVFEHEIVGFIVFTTEPSEFMKKGIMKNLFCFFWLVLVTVFSNPKKIIQIFRAYQLERAINKGRPAEAAVLSFGVLKNYRRRSFIRKNGIRISNELFEKVIDSLKRFGVGSLRLLIDSGNMEAMLFYISYGCYIKKIKKKNVSILEVNCSI